MASLPSPPYSVGRHHSARLRWDAIPFRLSTFYEILLVGGGGWIRKKQKLNTTLSSLLFGSLFWKVREFSGEGGIENPKKYLTTYSKHFLEF